MLKHISNLSVGRLMFCKILFIKETIKSSRNIVERSWQMWTSASGPPEARGFTPRNKVYRRTPDTVFNTVVLLDFLIKNNNIYLYIMQQFRIGGRESHDQQWEMNVAYLLIEVGHNISQISTSSLSNSFFFQRNIYLEGDDRYKLINGTWRRGLHWKKKKEKEARDNFLCGCRVLVLLKINTLFEQLLQIWWGVVD